MLSYHMLQKQSFENLILEARNQIPLYSEEWTNFNPSEPAETILENLSAFTILQQEYIDRMPEEVQEKLFAMAGFFREKGRSARVLLEAKNVAEAVRIPAGQRFRVGDLYFETNREFKLWGNRLTGVYGRDKEGVKDFSQVLDEDYPVGSLVFTETPKAGMELYLLTDGMGEPGEEIILYVRLAEEYQRNTFVGKNLFAELQWQLYTEKGFVDIRSKDGTGSFLTSGELRFRLPKEEAAVYEELPQKGYVIRGILRRADYDIPPKFAHVSGFLFEVWQKETKAICHTYGKQQSIELFSDILEEGYVRIFCKENRNGAYYLYEQAPPGAGKGRYYRLERLDYGIYRFDFDRQAFGFAPGDFENAVKLVAYSGEMMQQYALGTLYGYDAQEIALPAQHIVKDSFSVIVMRQDAAGETAYDFVKPASTLHVNAAAENSRPEKFRYSLLENEGIMIIEDADDCIDSQIFLGGCAVSRGEEGNIRAGSRFLPLGYESEVIFENPAPGVGGCYPESVAEVRQRLIADLRKHYTAVEAGDYEELVRTTPELCIHKVKAVRDDVKNQIQIAVKPGSREPFPRLSEIYRKAIRERLEKARLLTVNISIQQPVYLPVHVRGTIYVKPHYDGSREQIEATIRRALDYIGTERNFGERFHFDALFHEIEALPCVKYIFELSAAPQSLLYAARKGLDIQPADNCLLYPGEIDLELNTME